MNNIKTSYFFSSIICLREKNFFSSIFLSSASLDSECSQLCICTSLGLNIYGGLAESGLKIIFTKLHGYWFRKDSMRVQISYSQYWKINRVEKQFVRFYVLDIFLIRSFWKFCGTEFRYFDGIYLRWFKSGMKMLQKG